MKISVFLDSFDSNLKIMRLIAHEQLMLICISAILLFCYVLMHIFTDYLDEAKGLPMIINGLFLSYFASLIFYIVNVTFPECRKRRAYYELIFIYSKTILNCFYAIQPIADCIDSPDDNKLDVLEKTFIEKCNDEYKIKNGLKHVVTMIFNQLTNYMNNILPLVKDVNPDTYKKCAKCLFINNILMNQLDNNMSASTKRLLLHLFVDYQNIAKSNLNVCQSVLPNDFLKNYS